MIVDVRATIREIRTKYELLSPLLSERVRRLWAATEARALGRGGISAVAAATTMSRNTIRSGVRELEKGIDPDDTGRSRQPGAGRKRIEKTNPEILVMLEELVDPLTRGDPESPLRWTAKSARKLASELRTLGHRVSPQKVVELLRGLGYSLQANRKTREGTQHPDRNAQFEYINEQAKNFLRRGQPVISVDTKKKELVGNFKNGGREWQPSKAPEKVRVHDFKDEELGKAIPYGVFDVGANEGWVSVGIDHDTAEFAVESIRRWWRHMGSKVYPEATELLITADAGGSNAYRTRAWKYHLQCFADEAGLKVGVSHYPPGTSKWNRIEHRMWSYITMNWRGKPLTSLEVIVSLIANTTTQTGLRIKAKLDRKSYPLGEKISPEEFDGIRIHPAPFHGDWNYAISPTYA